MNDVTKPGTVQVTIAIDLDLSDKAGCQHVLEEITTMITQLNAVLSLQVIVVYGPTKAGRPPLTAQEWEDRFATVERIVAVKESLGITLKQACAREGVPYDTVLYWKRKSQEMRKDT